MHTCPSECDKLTCFNAVAESWLKACKDSPRDVILQSLIEGFCLHFKDVRGAFIGNLITRDRKTGYTRTGYVEEANKRFYGRVVWHPRALRIGLLRRSALQNGGLDAPVILQ